MVLDIFISGENINLCIPTKDFALSSRWYSWFNNPKINRFLAQGVFPNTPDLQVKFFEEEKFKRLLLIISNKREYMGVVSLSNVDLINKTAELAIVVDSTVDTRNTPMIALEATARISEHAFQIMGLKRISAGQHYKLDGWQQRMELLGYRVEGIKTNAFVKGTEVADIVMIAATYDDYLRILRFRSAYWDSSVKMLERAKKLPKRKFIDCLNDLFNGERENYYSSNFAL